MSTTTEQQFTAEQWLDVHFKMSADRKYDSASHRRVILERMRSFGIAPSTTSAYRAIRELVQEQKLFRADGGSEAGDRATAKAREEARLKQIASAPLTNEDYHEFSQLHPDQVAKLFYSDRAWATRYRAASARWGFRIPEPPAPADTDFTEADDPSEWRGLTADQYFHQRAADICRLYRSDRGYKRAVDRLIRDGKI